MPHMSRWIKITSVAIAAVAVVVLAYAVLAPQPEATDSDHNGMWGMHSTYNSSNVTLMVISAFVIVAALMVAVLWKGYEPLPPSMLPVDKTDAAGPETATDMPQAPVEESDPNEAAAHNYLVLRLLSGDERTMYKVLMDSGGEAFQKDLMERAKMSNAKVSRVLDRLSAKGIITKERHGSTNKIRIRLDR
jgi:uncharacterized membrane protein